MPKRSKRSWIVIITALAAMIVSTFALREAATWNGRPFAGVLLDPNGIVSSFGLPSWQGFQLGLRYKDRFVEVDGQPLTGRDGRPGAAWNQAILRAADAGEETVHVRVETPERTRHVELRIEPFGPSSWWFLAGVSLLLGWLYTGAALIARSASPDGPLARAFSKTALFGALFFFTIFDYQTTRSMVPLFHLAFAMVPVCVIALSLRLPSDARIIQRFPWILPALDACGVGLFVVLQLMRAYADTARAMEACSGLFAFSLLFFAATFFVRFFGSTGSDRATMRALLVSTVPTYLVVGSAVALASLRLGGATVALTAEPALALMPVTTVYAFVRYDLWDSRALLSRVLARGLIVAVVFVVAVTAGAGVASLLSIPLGGALIVASVSGIFGAVVVAPALRVGDLAMFRAREAYKPTALQLSEELTLLSSPKEVVHAVERIVHEWLDADEVSFTLVGREMEAEREPSGDGGEIALAARFRGQKLAVLRVARRRGRPLFTSEDDDLLRTVANQAAVAVANAQSYAELEERRREQAAAFRGEREALIEALAAEIAHEVRYPINYFRSIFQRGSSGQELDAEEIEIGCEEVERLERLVSGMRKVATRRLERKTTTVAELVAKTELLMRDQLAGRTFVVDIDGEPVIRCDTDQTTQILVNLVANAIEASGESGHVGVSWANEGGDGALTVWDTGPGFDGDPGKLFTPWYTTKPRGTGLGLAITHRIVRAHGWQIDPKRSGDRTEFVVHVPRRDLATERLNGGES